MSLCVVRSGWLTSVQDAGREGRRAAGIATCGALDDLALVLANRLVGNPADAAAIECTMGSAAFRFEGPARFALAGASCGAELDGEPIDFGQSQVAVAGQTLALHAPILGVRTVVAVRGGIDVPRVLGSRSTDLAAGFGGLEGRALRAEDRLGFCAGREDRFPNRLRVRAPEWCEPDGSIWVRALRGPDDERISADAVRAFWETPWFASPQSDRMGLRLGSAGGSPIAEGIAAMRSHAVFPGVVQMTPSGEPIALLSDAQTTGGYPKIACAIAADRWKLAQVRAGDTVRFVECTRGAAREARAKRRAYADDIERALATQMRSR